jgi:ribosomal protein L33
MEKNLILKDDEFLGHCEVCKHETVHKVIDSKPGYDSVGMLGTVKIECQECKTSFWV